MPTISVKDNKNNRWKGNTKTKQQNNNNKKRKGDGSYSKMVSDKWFCWAFKLGFLQLNCKASVIFKSNLELALSIKTKENYMSQSMLQWSVDVHKYETYYPFW